MDHALFDRIAALSRLSFEGEARERMAQDMESILRLMDTIAAVPFSEEEFSLPADGQEVLRGDVAQPSLSREELLANAKGKKEGFFTVPKMMG